MDRQAQSARRSPATSRVKGSSEIAKEGHDPPAKGRRCGRAALPSKSRGAFQVGTVQLFLLGFSHGAGINGPSSADKSDRCSEPLRPGRARLQQPRAAARRLGRGSESRESAYSVRGCSPHKPNISPAAPTPFQTLLSCKIKLKGVRGRSREEKDLCSFR